MRERSGGRFGGIAGSVEVGVLAFVAGNCGRVRYFLSGNVDPTKPLVPAPPTGGPAWVNSTKYVIEATAGSRQSGAMMRGPWMQALLEERFQLKIHCEATQGPVYFLIVDKNWMKLRPNEPGSCLQANPIEAALSPPPNLDGKPVCVRPIVSRRGPLTVFDLHGATLGVFSTFVHPDGLPVIVHTGLAGAYDFHLEWETDADGGARSDDPSTVILAIREQLGLRWNAGKGGREVLVIDHEERPSQN